MSSAPNRWASHPLRTSAKHFLAEVRSGIPVALIATPRHQFECERDDKWQDIENRHELDPFDQIPLICPKNQNIRAVYLRGRGRVDLQEEMFMAADAPLISFLEFADRYPFRFLISGSELTGLVTLSDVQKLPVYSVIFNLLIAAEMLLTERLRKYCGVDPDKWFTCLPPNEKARIEKQFQRAVKHSLDLDRLACASLGQKLYGADLVGLFNGHKQVKATFAELRKLRNKVYHASEFAPTPAAALAIPQLIRDAHSVIEWLH